MTQNIFLKKLDIQQDYQNLSTKLKKNILEKANKFHFEKDKNLFLARHLFLSEILQKHCKEKVEIIYNKFEKPYLKNNEYYFSMSKSEEFVVIALDKKNEIGIDIEHLRDFVDFEETLELFLNKSEIKILDKFSDKQEKQKYFFKFWTAKEAFVKALGFGLSEKLFDISFALNKNGELFIESHNLSKIVLLTQIEEKNNIISLVTLEKEK